MLIADLFLGWERVTLRLGDVAEVTRTADGWSGWGAKAGLCALSLLVLHVARAPSWLRVVAALGPVFFIAIELLDGGTDLEVARGAVSVAVETRWPAWAGLGLATICAAATALPLLTGPVQEPAAADGVSGDA